MKQFQNRCSCSSAPWRQIYLQVCSQIPCCERTLARHERPIICSKTNKSAALCDVRFVTAVCLRVCGQSPGSWRILGAQEGVLQSALELPRLCYSGFSGIASHALVHGAVCVPFVSIAAWLSRLLYSVRMDVCVHIHLGYMHAHSQSIVAAATSILFVTDLHVYVSLQCCLWQIACAYVCVCVRVRMCVCACVCASLGRLSWSVPRMIGCMHVGTNSDPVICPCTDNVTRMCAMYLHKCVCECSNGYRYLLICKCTCIDAHAYTSPCVYIYIYILFIYVYFVHIYTYINVHT